MESLIKISRATEILYRTTDFGEVGLTTYKIHFEPAEIRNLSNTTLSKTYRSKPLVNVDGEALFGELAILRYLQKDGWDGVWVDTFHGRGKKKVFWSGMPPHGQGNLRADAHSFYDRIVENNGGKSSGFFDVFAWRDNSFIFIEYKGEGDSSNQNELRWINSALRSGVKPEDMYFVTY